MAITSIIHSEDEATGLKISRAEILINSHIPWTAEDLQTCGSSEATFTYKMWINLGFKEE